tara:strand:- start:367 stop:663 length:297 start_codon:yes stop_codon:yes gene_type:complete
MSRNLVLPFFPIPPNEYEQQYFETLIRNFAVYLDQIQNPGEGRSSTFVMTNLQQNDSGLEVGSLFNHGGFVKISESHSPHVATNVGTTAVGSVTVTIS